MKIKKVKKIKNVTKGDVLLLSVIDQNDAGVYSDITSTNVISIVEKVTIKGKTATILTAGGYEFSYPKDKATFVLGTIDRVEKDAIFLYKLFNQSNAKIKEINSAIETLNDIDRMIKSGNFENKEQETL